MSVLFFKKPRKVGRRNGPLGIFEEAEDSRLSDCYNFAAIPPELSFENIICNKCAPPCSLQDFLDYVFYVEGRAENLQFYLWMVDYYQRFQSTPESLTALSPPWTHAKAIDASSQNNCINGDEERPSENLDAKDFSVDIASVSTWNCEQTEFSDNFTQTRNTLKFSVSPVKSSTSHHKSISWPPHHLQPFRTEIDRIINHYLAAGSPRQLNLSREDRVSAIRALKYTTHPSALSMVKRMLDRILRRESHPNFVRWSICNGNRQWTLAIRIFGFMNLVLGFMIAIILTLSRRSRYWRIFAAIEWFLGLANIIAASQGLCILLHRLQSRQHHVWEIQELALDSEATLRGASIHHVTYEETKPKWPVKMEVFGPANIYNREPWVEAYHRRSWLRKLFERRTPVHEPGLRNLQSRMIRQAHAWAFLLTIPLTVVFVALPKGNFF